MTFVTKMAFKMSQGISDSTVDTSCSLGTYVMLTLSCVSPGAWRDVSFRGTRSYVYELAAPSTSCVVEEEERAVFCVVCVFWDLRSCTSFRESKFRSTPGSYNVCHQCRGGDLLLVIGALIVRGTLNRWAYSGERLIYSLCRVVLPFLLLTCTIMIFLDNFAIE